MMFVIGDKIRFKDNFMEGRELSVAAVNDRCYLEGKEVPVVNIEFEAGGRIGVFMRVPQSEVEKI